MKILIKFVYFGLIIFIFTTCEKKPTEPKENVYTYTQFGTPFESIPAVSDIVMYEINLRAFSPAGDLAGVIERLDQIDSLGVNVIWLMPIYPEGDIKSVNSPYCIRDYKAVSSEYGNLEDLRNLVTQAHERDMAVILDWVANHTSWDNSWIENEGWYTQDSEGNVIHPAGTNWEDVADLNYNNSDMKTAMIDAMEYWILEANVDGFRCDYADGVPYAFWETALEWLKKIPDRELIFLAEGSRANHFDAGFDLTYGWRFYSKMLDIFDYDDADLIYTIQNYEYNYVPEESEILRFTTNHDESAWNATPVTLFNNVNGALAASVVTIIMDGAPLIYCGQEVGRSETLSFFDKTPINWNANPEMLQQYRKILEFYNSSEIARRGENTYYCDGNIICFKKELDVDSVLVIVNVRNYSVNFTIPDELRDTVWQNALTGAPVQLGVLKTLAPYEFCILD